MKKLTVLFIFTFLTISVYAQDNEVQEKGSNAFKTSKAAQGNKLIKIKPKSYTGEERTNAYNDILFFIGDKQVAEEEIKKIHPDDIAAIQVVKNKEEMIKYTREERDGVIIITLKE